MRAMHVNELLQANVNVILSDSDAIWLKNPFTTGLFTSKTGDIVAG